jgi:hypothetical protein
VGERAEAPAHRRRHQGRRVDRPETMESCYQHADSHGVARDRRGDELRFDCNTTESELAEPFVCNCGAPTCVGVAMGFTQLSSTRLEILLRDAAPHIRALHAAGLSIGDRELQPVSLGAQRRDHRRHRRASRR